MANGTRHASRVTSGVLDAAAVGVLCVLTGIVFGQLPGFDFINYDDPYFISLNPHVTGGLSMDNLRWAFSTRELGIWHPLTWLSYQLESTLFGPENPGARHAVNVALHLANGILVYLLCLRLTGHRWPSLLVAVLFIVHPQHVQPVAWIAERKEVLCALFFLASLNLYAVYREGRMPHVAYPLALLAFLLALLSKPSATPLPVILVLIDVFFVRADRLAISPPDGARLRTAVSMLYNKIPFFLASAAAGGVAVYIKKTGNWAGYEELLPLGRRLLLMPVGLVHYLWTLVLPWPNPMWIEPPDGMPTARSLLSLGVVALLGYGVWLVRKRFPELSFGALWFVVMWLPISGIVLVSNYYVADRYTYLPYIGCFFGLAFCLYKLAPARTAIIAASAAVLLLSVAAYRQTAYWQDATTFFVREMEINPGNAKAPLYVGQALMLAGEHHKALAHFEQSIELDDRPPEGYAYRGDALRELGRLDEAIRSYRLAVERRPNHADVYTYLGKLLADGGHGEEAAVVFEQGHERFPDDIHLLNQMAYLYAFGLQREQRALELYREALDIDPDNTHALHGAGVLKLRTGRVSEGVALLRRVLAIEPENEPVRRWLEAFSSQATGR